MTEVKFYSINEKLTGFEISGHSGYAEEGSDIICASISSCAYMVANTITEIVNVEADIEVSDGYMSLAVSLGDADKIKDLMLGFELHVKALADEYRKYLSCKKEIIR